MFKWGIKMNFVFLLSSIFLLILSIPLFFGKMSNIIAGYNTMNDKQKEQYDELKLCRIIAMIIIGLAIILLLGALYIISSTNTILVGISEIMIGVIVGNFFAKEK